MILAPRKILKFAIGGFGYIDCNRFHILNHMYKSILIQSIFKSREPQRISKKAASR